jgi:hypothetical protein
LLFFCILFFLFAIAHAGISFNHCAVLFQGPSSPADFIRAVVRKGNAMKEWFAKSQSGSLLKSGGQMMLGCDIGLHMITGLWSYMAPGWPCF